MQGQEQLSLQKPPETPRTVSIFQAGIRFGLTGQGEAPAGMTEWEEDRWNYGIRCGQARKKM